MKSHGSTFYRINGFTLSLKKIKLGSIVAYCVGGNKIKHIRYGRIRDMIFVKNEEVYEISGAIETQNIVVCLFSPVIPLEEQSSPSGNVSSWRKFHEPSQYSLETDFCFSSSVLGKVYVSGSSLNLMWVE